MKKSSLEAGKDLADLQMTSMVSSALYSFLKPRMVGPASGRTGKEKKYFQKSLLWLFTENKKSCLLNPTDM